MNSSEACLVCAPSPILLFACSGGSDVGELADRAGRVLNREGGVKMYCLAGIGGRIAGILATTEAASGIVAVDGCPLNCAKRSLEEVGIADFTHVRLAEHGFAKGQSPADDAHVAAAAEILREAVKTTGRVS